MSRRAYSRRALLRGTAAVAVGAPWVLRAQGPLALDFRTIPDPDGWHPSLRLKGDWLVFEVTDGVLSGFGEASHSRDDEGCRRAAAALFQRHYVDFELSLETLRRKEAEIAALNPDFVTATAYSGINQALYDLLAKREQVPVWRLFAAAPGYASLPLYTTINRALTTRSNDEYLALVADVAAQGFRTFKCAPFEAVDNAERVAEKSEAGLRTLEALRRAFPDLGIRVDFHERFGPASFFALLPRLERLALDWIEEPFAMGANYTELRQRTKLRVAAGELFWGEAAFKTIWDNEWADVIMPDVKHVGGFGPLLEVLRQGQGRIEISPHNPSGPISTAASLHAGVLFPDVVRSLEFAFDKTGSRRATGEIVEAGSVHLSDRPGWGVEPA
jgi:galactonate dehydratase